MQDGAGPGCGYDANRLWTTTGKGYTLTVNGGAVTEGNWGAVSLAANGQTTQITAKMTFGTSIEQTFKFYKQCDVGAITPSGMLTPTAAYTKASVQCTGSTATTSNTAYVNTGTDCTFTLQGHTCSGVFTCTSGKWSATPACSRDPCPYSQVSARPSYPTYTSNGTEVQAVASGCTVTTLKGQPDMVASDEICKYENVPGHTCNTVKCWAAQFVQTSITCTRNP